jgi:hypothetical protein
MLLHLLRSFNVLVEIKPSDLFGGELRLPGEEVTREGGGGGVLVQVVQGHAKHIEQAGHSKHLATGCSGSFGKYERFMVMLAEPNEDYMRFVQVHEYMEHVQSVQEHVKETEHVQTV